jgi:hypothetical protein
MKMMQKNPPKMIDMGKWLLLGFETFDRQVSQLFFEEK